MAMVPPLASEDRVPAVAGRRIATVAIRPAGAAGRRVAVAAVGSGDGRAAVGADVDRRLVGDRAAVDRDVAAWCLPTTMVLPTLPPELMSPTVTAPPLALATATPPLPAAASPPLPFAPPAPPAAALPLPPLALETAVPPSALMARVVLLRTCRR